MIYEVRISYKPGVQDPEGESTLEGLRALGFEKVEEVRSAKLYVIKSDYDLQQIEEMCKRLLANPISQDYEIREVKQHSSR